MKRQIIVLISALLVVMGLAALNSAAAAKPALPAVITSAGQSPDGMMVDVMLNRKLGMKIPFLTMAKVQDLKNVKTLIVAVGVSNKGLGAAGIDLATEAARVKSLMNYAKDEEINVILVHIGGQQRRGAGSEQMLKLVIPLAKWYVVVKTGNQDHAFDRWADANNASLTELNAIIEAGPAIKKLFD